MEQKKNIMDYDTVSLDDESSAVVIIDQTKLPGTTEIIALKTAQEIWDAIYLLQVRGAPAIGVAAAYGIYVLAKGIDTDNYDEFYAEFKKQKEYLDRFLSICNYIDEHCTEDLSLDQVAKTAGFSKYHFTRLFKQFTNTTYYKYLNRKRIDHAMLLLSDPDIPVTEAALQSGFSSLSTFLRVFRSVKQCTPTEFRDMYIYPEKLQKNP